MSGSEIISKRIVFAEEGDVDAVRRSLSLGSDLDAEDEHGLTALLAAARGGRVEVVQLLLDAGADPNYAEQNEFRTALMAAASGGHSEVVRLLIERGAYVDAADDYDDTALCMAIAGHHSKIVEALLQAGANPNKPGELGLPLVLTEQAGLHEIIAMLRAAGA